MTTNSPIPPEEDDIVGRVVEKAAEKVATSVASVTNGNVRPTMSRVEAWGAVLALIILNIASLVSTLTLHGDHERLNDISLKNRETTKAVCELIGQAIPNVDPGKLSICLAK
jgi:hypothetical protein